MGAIATLSADRFHVDSVMILAARPSTFGRRGSVLAE